MGQQQEKHKKNKRIYCLPNNSSITNYWKNTQYSTHTILTHYNHSDMKYPGLRMDMTSVRSSLCILNRVTALVLFEMTKNMAPFTQSYPCRIKQSSQNKTSTSNQIKKKDYSGIKLIWTQMHAQMWPKQTKHWTKCVFRSLFVMEQWKRSESSFT